MRTVPWNRATVIEEIRADVWRHVTQAARAEDELTLEASALLQMKSREVRTLARIQFIMSEAAQRLIDQMPYLSRRLTNTAIPEEERSTERVRGAIRWAATFAERAATGLPHVYVTAPSRRAFQTQENEVLIHALRAIRDEGRRTGWDRRGEHLSPTIRKRVDGAERWLRTRALSEVTPVPVTPKLIGRVRSGRAAQRYAPAVDVTLLHLRYLRRLDRSAIRTAIEDFALVASTDDVLLELLALFEVERAFRRDGWSVTLPGLVAGRGRVLDARRHGERVSVYYQRTPEALSSGSRYGEVQVAHQFGHVGTLRPDLILKATRGADTRWVIVEVKGLQREVQDSAREAIQNLMAYRWAFDATLSGQEGPYGLGVAWGADLTPRAGQDELLCTPDTIPEALRLLFPGD
jgi:hypothetical protein